MKASLTLNHDNQIALFYDDDLGFEPEWVSLDLDLGTIFLGGSDIDNKAIKLNDVDQRIYKRIKDNTEILLIRLKKGQDNKVLGTITVPLMLPSQL